MGKQREIMSRLGLFESFFPFQAKESIELTESVWRYLSPKNHATFSPQINFY